MPQRTDSGNARSPEKLFLDFVHRELCKVTCNKPSLDSYDATNLISDVPGIRQKGFLAESFISPPVSIVVEFVTPIEISHVVVNTRVGSHKTTDLELYLGKGDPSNGWQLAPSFGGSNLYFASKAHAGAENWVYFTNHNFIGRPWEIVQPVNACCRKIAPLNGTIHIGINVTRTSTGGVPAIGRLEVWGRPSTILSQDTYEKIRAIYCTRYEQKKSANPADRIDAKLTTTVGSSSDILPEDIPSEFVDSISCDVMTLPTLLPSGHNVDQQTLEKYKEFEASYGRLPNDPFTGLAFTNDRKPLFNAKLKSRIDAFLLSRPHIAKNIAQTVGQRHNSPNWSTLLQLPHSAPVTFQGSPPLVTNSYVVEQCSLPRNDATDKKVSKAQNSAMKNCAVEASSKVTLPRVRESTVLPSTTYNRGQLIQLGATERNGLNHDEQCKAQVKSNKVKPSVTPPVSTNTGISRHQKLTKTTLSSPLGKEKQNVKKPHSNSKVCTTVGKRVLTESDYPVASSSTRTSLQPKPLKTKNSSVSDLKRVGQNAVKHNTGANAKSKGNATAKRNTDATVQLVSRITAHPPLTANETETNRCALKVPLSAKPQTSTFDVTSQSFSALSVLQNSSSKLEFAPLFKNAKKSTQKVSCKLHEIDNSSSSKCDAMIQSSNTFTEELHEIKHSNKTKRIAHSPVKRSKTPPNKDVCVKTKQAPASSHSPTRVPTLDDDDVVVLMEKSPTFSKSVPLECVVLSSDNSDDETLTPPGLAAQHKKLTETRNFEPQTVKVSTHTLKCQPQSQRLLTGTLKCKSQPQRVLSLKRKLPVNSGSNTNAHYEPHKKAAKQNETTVAASCNSASSRQARDKKVASFRLLSHEEELKQNLDLALKHVLGSLPDYINFTNQPTSISEGCDCSVPSSELYSLPCNHRLCRFCLLQKTNSLSSKSECSRCKKTFSKCDPIRVFTK